MTAELGDPWVIAQTVIDAEEAKRGMSRNDGSAYTYCGQRISAIQSMVMVEIIRQEDYARPESGIPDTCTCIWL